jgi:hypothetical protein
MCATSSRPPTATRPSDRAHLRVWLDETHEPPDSWLRGLRLCVTPGAVGGRAWILVNEHAVASGSGATPSSSTHNAAELTAAIEGLPNLVGSGFREAEVVSDSRYLVGGMMTAPPKR